MGHQGENTNVPELEPNRLQMIRTGSDDPECKTENRGPHSSMQWREHRKDLQGSLEHDEVTPNPYGHRTQTPGLGTAHTFQF